MNNIVSDITLFEDQWEEFVNKHPRGSVFHTRGFNLAFQHGGLYKSTSIAYIEPGTGRLIGLLPAVILQDYQGIIGRITRRCILFDAPLAVNDDPSIQKKLIVALEKEIRKRVVFTQYRFSNPIGKELYDFFIEQKYYYEPYLNILVDTTIGAAELWKQIKRNRKDGINKGKKQGFVFYESKESNSVDDFYDLLGETYKKARLPYPQKELFVSLKKYCSAENLRFFELKSGDEKIISLLSFLSKDKLYAYYIGINQDENILRQRPVDYFYWEILQWCSANGVKSFDWMGAGQKNKDYGVRDFKLQYGGLEYEPGRMSKFHNLFIRLFFNQLLFIWKKLR